MTKTCCGDASIYQDVDGQVRCDSCDSIIYDYLNIGGDGDGF